MKELVEVVAKALVDNPDEVVVTEKTEGRSTVIELHVAASDMGKVIGKQGRIAKAIRTVVKAAGVHEIREFFQVGIITSTHGLRGEVKVFPTTDDVKRFKRLQAVILDTGKERLDLEIETVKFFKQFVF